MDYPDTTYEKIGRIVRCSKQRVDQIAKSVALTRMGMHPYHRSDITVDRVLKLYHHNWLIKEIASILGCNPSTVTKRLREVVIDPGKCFSRNMKLY